MKTSPLILSLFFLSISLAEIQAQETKNDSFRKIDVNVNFSISARTNLTQGNPDALKSVQGLITFYPLQFRRIQMGFSLGMENVKTPSIDSIIISENRIPILATAKINVTKGQEIYIRTQLGTGLTTSSTSTTNGTTIKNNRDDIGAPIIACIGIGINLPIKHVGVGIEFGYTYKQLGYKLETDYNTGGFYLGISTSFP